MFTIEFNNDQISQALGRVATALGDMTPVTGKMAETWRKSTQARMERGEQPDGAPFAPRSPITLEKYAAQGFSFGAPLNLTGEMRQQLSTESGPDFLRIGSNAIQAAVMQFGASQGEFGAHIGKDKLGRDHFHSIPWGDIPARPFLGISDEDETNMMAELAEWLENAASGAN